MGNSLPITSPPSPSPSRAVILLEPQCIRSYLREPWRRPVGELQVVGSAEELPPALDGVVPIEVYREMMKTLIERASNYRGRYHSCTSLLDENILWISSHLIPYSNGIYTA